MSTSSTWKGYQQTESIPWGSFKSWDSANPISTATVLGVEVVVSAPDESAWVYFNLSLVTWLNYISVEINKLIK